ncbi:MAG: tetraacyldisaccharide 4'-kinase [Deltaproteobacteria bacterium]|nr:tetraacyldisaccharide 4'-kinase [Deltaproteobacteria bacterium]
MPRTVAALFRPWAGPLARLVEGVAVRRRRPLPAAGSRQLPTLAVHGLALGGTGKTPLVAWLARRLSRAEAGPVGVGTRERSLVGDETALLERQLPGCAVLAARRPADVASRAAAVGCRVLVLDDPSLTRPVPAHLRLVCLRPGDDWAMPVFPAGERRPGSVRAWEADHLVLFDGARPPRGTGLPVTRARVVPDGLVELGAWARSGADAPRVRAAGRRLFLLCAVARPERVVASLASLGVTVVGRRALRDHAALPAVLRGRLEQRAVTLGADGVAITEKDAARILAGRSRIAAARLPWLVVRTRLELSDDGRALLDEFARRTGVVDGRLRPDRRDPV